jgi:transcriptional regulator with XRE-family HTH domain
MTNEIETHVRVKIRHARWMLSLSQDELGKKAGLGVSEIRRLEAGEDPISVTSLWAVAKALNAPVAFFFEGLEGQATDADALRGTSLMEQEAMKLVRTYSRLPPEQRKGVMDLVQMLRDAAG